MIWIYVLESICIILGALWSLFILMVNTGDSDEHFNSEILNKFKDQNSLAMTMLVTFSLPFIIVTGHLIYVFA